ncbi:ABC transporter ATP-binding protein [Anaeropeptidivorans aminofermentans]|uniref:ABC transporter ATP-binding protein n=1 Tax=Anaeropeptidivorans aminofermentans TaxID=2934315 RepID=UPI002023DC58|nr:ABC transporter ATP-binding protein [Anaeropeptidivorans aminofermentans]
MLQINDVYAGYGKLEILHGININVKKGEIVTIIGNNGAGKTTSLRALCGLVNVFKGNIKFKDEDITNIPAHNIVAKGLVMVPEGRHIFTKLTVRENLNMGGYLQKDKQEFMKDLEMVYGIFPRLKEREKQSGGSLSGGEQQMLAMARAMLSRPELLVLDEPSMGLAPQMIEKILETTVEINKKGTTVLLVEQNAFLALQIASRAYVLETGMISVSGDSKDLLADESIRKAYLGDN